MEAPQHPAGPHVAETALSSSRRDELISVIEHAPAALLKAVEGLTETQLDLRYRNWSIRQIVHHLGDSHVNSYIRFKWTLTEDRPTIKAYDEGAWASLADSASGDLAPALALYDGLHRRWVQLLRNMTPEQFARTFHHPESNEIVSLDAALGYYAWHCRHHTAQIEWVRASRIL